MTKIEPDGAVGNSGIENEGQLHLRAIARQQFYRATADSQFGNRIRVQATNRLLLQGLGTSDEQVLLIDTPVAQQLEPLGAFLLTCGNLWHYPKTRDIEGKIPQLFLPSILQRFEIIEIEASQFQMIGQHT